VAELTGQVAVVTGAARGIGAAIARRLASMGATVAITARDEARLNEVAREIESSGGKAEIAAFDLLDPAAVTRFAETIQKRYGRCDILVNNAGVGFIGSPLHQMPPEDWDTVLGNAADWENRISRNEPCPCGSGRKYKHCHGQL